MIPEEALESMVESLFEKGIWVGDGLFDGAWLNDFRESLDHRFKKQGFKKSSIGQGSQKFQNESVRGDYIHWLDESDVLPIEQVLWDELNRWKQYLNRTCYLGLQSIECHYAIYPKGAFYKKHWDNFKGKSQRKLTFILYLNPDWMAQHGGELVAYLPDVPMVLAPIMGRLLLFDSTQIPHEVLPTNAERWSLTGWFKHTRCAFRKKT